MSDTEPVSIRILDRDYTVGVQPAQREGLLAAARLLEKRMHEIRGGNRMVAMERVAVLAALNLAHELEQLKQDRLQREEKIERALQSLEQSLAASGDS